VGGEVMCAMKSREESGIFLTTKLYIPQARQKAVLRKDLIECLNVGKNRKLSLVCAPAGFGKTTLVSEWIACCDLPVAWLSLDEGDNDVTRFLIYLVSAIRIIVPTVGEGIMFLLKSPRPPQINWILTNLINEIITKQDNFTLVLDDYHVIDSKVVNDGICFLLENLPPQMHLTIISRDIPNLPLAQLRVRNQLTELRVKDLCFTPLEVSEFLNGVMSLNLGAGDIAALETRTEGWIAGLQLAAISLQGHNDATAFINSFTGNHYFVMDYLVEEVLQQQPESIQRFLLYTSILERLCGPLCDALLYNGEDQGHGVGKKI
jgi:LuxR family maltose regulon positive regulatory protein